jgi:hypothetical protein
MKRKYGNYSQICNRVIYKLNKHNHKVSFATRWLYVHLNFLENKFTGSSDKDDFFIHTIKEISNETGISNRQIGKSIRVLKDLGLIQTWQAHWIYKNTGKKSEKHMTAFRMLEA